MPALSSASLVTDRTLDTHTDSAEELFVADPLIGVVVADRYRILERLGRGGMGVVYRVEHARIGKLMALKLLSGELGRDATLVARFKREALLASRLSHPNTVQVFDFGSSDGLVYLAMELLRGNDLGRIVRHGGPLGATRVTRIVIQICNSLSEAHAEGIVHRDLKPENIMIVRGQSGDDVVKVLDFGLAKLRESKELGDVTSRGAIVGTPYYMSPEQIRGEPVDARSDIYALGALMYACLTGQPVFDAPTPMGVLTKHLTETPIAPRERDGAPAIPSALNQIVLRCLEKDPALRFESARALQTALVESLRRESTSSSVDLLLDSKRVGHLADQDSEAATRAEVERYERKLKRRGALALSTALGVVLGLGVGGYHLWAHERAALSFDGGEREPNDTVGTANLVPFGAEVRGQLGRRLDRERGDRDFFRVSVPPEATAVSLSLTALPNLASCLWVYQSGEETSLGRYCSGRMGADLEIGALTLPAGPYLLLVTQDRDAYDSNPPPPVLENVSDSYRLRLARVEPTREREVEPNDTVKDASPIAIGQTFHGKLAWMRDIDVVCLARGSGRARFVVSDAPRTRAAVLRVTPRGGARDGIAVRVHGAGTDAGKSESDVSGEWSSPEVDTTPAPACLELELVVNPWAPPPHPNVAPAGAEEYTVRVEAG
ncbi:MAG: serine/threonine-protein kinase [Deltaproteobacteria bacterium]|nr:serine/threonine-protein kinase [Deltaproteobacteria bacterium]